MLRSSNKGDIFLCDGSLSTVKVVVNTDHDEDLAREVWLGLIADSKDRGIFPELTTKVPIKFDFSFDEKKSDPTFTIKSADKSLENFDQNTSTSIKFPPIFQTVKNNDDEIVYLFNNGKMVNGQKDYEVKKLIFHKKTNNIELLYGTWSYTDGDNTLDTKRTYISSNRISANCKK